MQIQTTELKNIISNIESYFIKENDFDYPLASGNCGVFAYALSRVLSESQIDHHFRIYNNDNSIFRDKSICSWNDACHYNAECSHIVVVINNEAYGASLGTAFDDCDSYDIFDMNKEDLLKYIYKETAYWIEHEEFYNQFQKEIKLLKKSPVSHFTIG